MMNRYLLWIVGALISAWPSGPIFSQSTPPIPPVASTPTVAPTPPDNHVRRHRMGDGSIRRLDTDIPFRAALQAHLDELRAQIAELETRLEEESDRELEAKLKQLQEELAELDSLRPLDLPDVITGVPDPSGRVLWNRDGSKVIVLDPDGMSTHTRGGEKVAYFSHLYINHDDWIHGPAVAILGNVHVLGHVEEDVVSVGGNVYVDGTVGGNVVAPFGDVYLNGDAYVEGNVVAVSLTADEDAQIGGTVEKLPLFRMPWINGGPQALLLLASAVAVTKLVLSLLLGFLIQAVAPLHAARVEERLAQRPVASFFGGVLMQIMILPVFVLLLVTVIGIPLALLALPLLLVAALMLGFVACSRIVGDRLLNQDGRRRSPALIFAVGALLLYSPLLLAALSTLTLSEPGSGWLFAVHLLFFLGVCVLYIVYTAGMGAALFSRLGTRSAGMPRRSSSGAAGAYQLPAAVTALPQAPPAADHS